MHAPTQECLQAWRKATKIVCFRAWWKDHAVETACAPCGTRYLGTAAATMIGKKFKS